MLINLLSPPLSLAVRGPAQTKVKDCPPSAHWQGVAAAVVALFFLGVVLQGMLWAFSLWLCDFDRRCAWSWFRSFVNYIDAPFKIMTFICTVAGAQSQPEKWLWFLDYVKPRCRTQEASEVSSSQFLSWDTKGRQKEKGH